MLQPLERWLYRRLSGPAGTNYGYRPGVVFETARRASIIKSVRYSRRFGAKVIVDRSARISVAPTATVSVARGAVVVIGINPPRHVTVIELRPRCRVELGGPVTLMGGCQVLVAHDATLRVGAGTYFNADTRIYCGHDIRIGRGCAVSWNVTLTDDDAHQIIRNGDHVRPRQDRVTIADQVWIGANSIVLKGVTIGENVVIAAGSVVTRTVPPRSLVGGNPATVIDADAGWTL